MALGLFILLIVVIAVSVLLLRSASDPEAAAQSARSLTVRDFADFQVEAAGQSGTRMEEIVSTIGAPDGSAAGAGYTPYYTLSDGSRMLLHLTGVEDTGFVLRALTICDELGREYTYPLASDN